VHGSTPLHGFFHVRPARALPVYIQALKKLEEAGAIWVQLDEPFLVTDLTPKQQQAFQYAYQEIRKQTNLKILVATYFEGLRNTEVFRGAGSFSRLPFHLSRCI